MIFNSVDSELKITFNTGVQRPCSRRVLAAGDYMLVEQCSCSAVHVTIGAVTLRLEGSALSSLAMTLQDAALAVVGERLKRAGAGARKGPHGDDEALS